MFMFFYGVIQLRTLGWEDVWHQETGMLVVRMGFLMKTRFDRTLDLPADSDQMAGVACDTHFWSGTRGLINKFCNTLVVPLESHAACARCDRMTVSSSR